MTKDQASRTTLRLYDEEMKLGLRPCPWKEGRSVDIVWEGTCQDREVARLSNRNGELWSTGCQEGQESGICSGIVISLIEVVF